MRSGSRGPWRSAERWLAAAVIPLAMACGSGGGSSSPVTTYRVTYNANGGAGGAGVPVDPNTYQQGQTVTVLGNTGGLTKSGASFSGWNTVAGGTGAAYTAGQTFTMGAGDVTLFAQWPVTASLSFAYAVNQGDGTVSQLTVGSNGALAALTPPSVACELRANSLAVDPSGKYLYVVNLRGATSASYGSISQYTIGAGGTLSPMTPAVVDENYGPSDIAVHPSGKYAYAITYYSQGAAHGASIAMSQYTIGADGTLTPMSTPAVAITGSNPQFIAIHPTGQFLYVSDGSGVVDQFTIASATGALSAMTPATVPFPFSLSGHTAFAITVHPSGKYAYVTDYYGGIAEYTIDASSGALSALAQTQVDGGNLCAAWITVDPSGKYAYVANCANTSQAISQFTVGTDGKLAAMTPASVAAPSAGTNVQVDSTGTHLYMTSGTSGTGTDVSQFSIGADGALAPMTPATVTVGASPNALVLVKR
jgi:6-phosphogluconolactonase (cycloisomerase 2 family)